MPAGSPSGTGRAGRFYLASSQISRAMVQSRTRQELLEEVVRVLVESGGFAMAFVAWYDPESQQLKPVARFGDTTGYVDQIRIFSDERPEGQGPAGVAFRSGVCYLCQDFLGDPRALPWREVAAAAGWRASAAIPIGMGGTPCGVVSAYSRETGIFGPEEMVLFEQVATDVSVGLERLDAEEKRRVAESALIISERRLKLAVDAAAIGIFEWDMITGEVVWDEHGQRLFGYEAGSFDGTYAGFADRIHPDDKAGVEHVIAVSSETRAPFVHEFRIVWPDGSVHWLSSRGEFTHDEAGRPVRLSGVTFDISDRKGAEAAYEEELKKLASIVEMSNEFIGIATVDGKVIYLNNAAMHLVGIGSVEEARQQTIFDFVSDEDRAQLAEIVYPRLMKEGFWSGEFRLRHFRTGEPIDVDITGFQIRDDRGFPLYIATVMRDITERKKAAAEKAKLEASLLQAQKMESIGRLAGAVAHDFNNMLTVIIGYAELAKSRRQEPQHLRRHLDEIVKAAERSRELTRQLLGFSRQQTIAPKPANLNSIIEELRHPLARLIGEDIELLFHPDPNLWRVLLDASQINQILINLAVNARDAMPNGGNLTIETANVRITGEYARTQADCTPGDYAMVAIRDDGSGMSRDVLTHIFEPFFTTKERGKGTGLGLATVYGIVKQNGGFVNVDSEIDQGTTFRIYFPRVFGENESLEPPRPAVQAAGGRVLLVEDDELVRAVTTAALKSIGYKPMVAASAQEALRICARSGSEIRLILTDVVMPEMTGAELWDRVRALHPDIKVLFMSGYTSNVIGAHGVLQKGVEFIQKPFSLEELGRKIAGILGSTDSDGLS